MRIRLESGLVGLAVLISGVSVLAQTPGPGGSSGSTMPTPLSMTNPYMNPYLNPYLNPALANQRPMTGRDAAMYLYMANSANGGLGSGRLSGTRPAPTGPTGDTQVAGRGLAGAAKPGAAATKAGATSRATRGKLRPAEMPNTASVPGLGAARFFNPGGGAARGANDYFGRRDMYFNNNRR